MRVRSAARLWRIVLWGLCVTVAAVPARGAERWAQGLFVEEGHDFGAVPRGAKVRHNFVLTNRLAEAVTILDVRASCGCTTGRALGDPIAPGQQAVVEAQMDTRNFVGNKATTLTVTMVTASGRQGEARLGVRSNILSDIVLNPGSLDFGVVSRSQGGELKLAIDRYGAPNWRIERMMASKVLSGFVDAKLQEAYRTPQGVGYVLTVKVKPDAPAGLLREEIRIATNDPETPVVPVLVTMEVQGRVSAAPAMLALGRSSAAAGGGVQGRVMIRGSEPFAIAGVEGVGDGFEVTGGEGGKKALHVLTIAFRADQTVARGSVRRTFRVATDLPGEPPVELQAVVNAAP